MLQKDFDVHVVGPGALDELWPPVRNDRSIEYRPYSIKSAKEFFLHRKAISKQLITGNVIIASKPLLTSFGLGLTARRILGVPLLLDNDDWELGFIGESLYWEARIYRTRWVTDPFSPLYTRILDKRTGSADALTVSNQFLQKRYGGLLIPHARDETIFQESIATYKSSVPVVLFLGTPRPNKGLDVLLQAWSSINHTKALLRIIGVDASSALANTIPKNIRNQIEFVSGIPYDELPNALSQAAVVVIPQRNDRGSLGQLPAKLIDAMAAGRAIVSTTVGDIPVWLADGAGILVPPNDPKALADAIEDLLNHPEKREQVGQKARERFLEKASFDALRPALVELINQLVQVNRSNISLGQT